MSALTIAGIVFLAVLGLFWTVFLFAWMKGWIRIWREDEDTFDKVIVAGNYTQAALYCSELGVSPNEFVIANSAHSLHGRRFRTSDVTYIGTFYRRNDLEEIMDVIDQITSMYRMYER